jgi:phosphomannomutase
MGLLIIEMVASSGGSLYELVEQLLREVGPVHYQRNDLRLSRPVSRDRMTQYLEENAPAHLAGESLAHVSSVDGVKYILSDDSWLLIRPSGTEPVLRVYAEGRSPEMVREMIGYGEQVAASVT